MATITSLGFSIWSKFNREGVDDAEKALSRLERRISETNTSFKAAGGQASAMTVAMMAMGPTAVVLGSSLAATGTAAVVNFGLAGAAAGVYGGVLAATVKRTTELQEEGGKLNKAQASYIKTTESLTATWNKFLDANAGKTLGVAQDFLEGLRAGIKRLQPIVDAMHPSVKRMSEAWQAWMEGPSAKRFSDSVVTYGVPAMDKLMMAGRNMLAVLGDGFRAFMPVGADFADSILHGSEALRKWSSEGGFQKFLAYVRSNAPMVNDFIQALVGALIQVSKALAETGPSLLKVSTAMLQMIASMPTDSIQAFFLTLMSLKVLIVLVGWIGQVVAALRILAFAFNIGMGPLGLIIIAIAALIAAIIWIAVKTTWFKDAWTWLWNGIKDIAAAVTEWFVSTWNAVWGTTKAVAQAVWGWLSTAWDTLWGGIKSVAKGVWDWMVGAWNTVTGGISEGGQSVVDWFSSWWDPMWHSVKSVAVAVWDTLTDGWNAVCAFFQDAYDGFIQPVIDAWNNVWPEVAKVLEDTWDVIVEVFSTAWGIISKICEIGWDVITTIFEAAWNVIKPIVELAWNIIVGVIEFALNLIGVIIEFGWDVVVGIFKAAWAVIAEVVRVAWDLIVSIFSAVFNVIWDVVKAFAAGFMAIWEPLWNLAKSIFVGVWEVAKAIWQAFVDAIEAILLTFLAIFTGNWEKAWTAITDFFESTWNLITTFFSAALDIIVSALEAALAILKAAWEIFWEFVKSFVTNILTAVWEFITSILEAIKNVWNAAIQFLADTLMAIFNAMYNFLKLMFETIQALFSTVLEWLKNLWNTVWTAVSTFFMELWQSLVDWLGMRWEDIKNMFNAALTWISDLWHSVWDSVSSWFRDTWQGLVDWLGMRWEDIKNMFSAAGTWLRTTFWDPLANFFTKTIPDTFKTAVDAIGRFWDGIKEIFAAPIRWVIDFVWNNGIRKAWNWINDLWGGKDIDPFTFSFAKGGPVRGPGTGTSDSINARLSDGEHVWTAREVSAAGGHEAVAAMRSNVLGGAGVRTIGNTNVINPQFAEGGGVRVPVSPAPDTPSLAGVVARLTGLSDETGAGANAFAGKLVEAAGGIGKNAITSVLDWIKNKLIPVSGGMGWAEMWKIVQGAFPASGSGPLLTSSLREGDPGYHGKGLAIDVAWPMTEYGKGKMLELNKWIASRYPDSTELIHTPGINLMNGKQHTYNAQTQSEHYNHVHWAMASGNAGAGPGGVAGGVEKWRALVVQELGHMGLAASQALQDVVLRRMNQESGGNPRAINNWDSNAAKGTPSKGLMQCIDPTFQANRSTMHPNDIWDPGANVHASMNYATRRYGSLEAAYNRKGGYESGTYGALAGIHSVAENGMELITRGPTPVRFRGGEKVWNNKDTRELLSNRGGSGGDVHIDLKIDLRGADVDAVRRAERSIPEAIRVAVKQGVGKRHGG